MSRHKAKARPYPNNIKYLIKLYGYKVVEVADELQIPRSTLYDYISGNRPAPKECLREIASFLGCDIEQVKSGWTLGQVTNHVLLELVSIDHDRLGSFRRGRRRTRLFVIGIVWIAVRHH